MDLSKPAERDANPVRAGIQKGRDFGLVLVNKYVNLKSARVAAPKDRASQSPTTHQLMQCRSSLSEKFNHKNNDKNIEAKREALQSILALLTVNDDDVNKSVQAFIPNNLSTNQLQRWRNNTEMLLTGSDILTLVPGKTEKQIKVLEFLEEINGHCNKTLVKKWFGHHELGLGLATATGHPLVFREGGRQLGRMPEPIGSPSADRAPTLSPPLEAASTTSAEPPPAQTGHAPTILEGPPPPTKLLRRCLRSICPGRRFERLA